MRQNFIKRLLSNFKKEEVFSVLFIDQKIADMAIEIRKKRRIKLPDAIIAATVKVLNLCLVTRNIDDFKIFTDLEVQNWHKGVWTIVSLQSTISQFNHSDINPWTSEPLNLWTLLLETKWSAPVSLCHVAEISLSRPLLLDFPKKDRDKAGRWCGYESGLDQDRHSWDNIINYQNSV